MKILYALLLPLLLLSCAPKFYNSYGKLVPADSILNYLTREANHLGLQPGDTMADIGAGDGSVNVVFSMAVPNLHQVLVDIDRKWLNKKRLAASRKLISRVKPSPNTFSHEIVINTATQIPLKTAAFGKVLCRKTLHEFSDPVPMLREMHRILKDSGQLMIVEAKPATPLEKDMNCHRLLLTADSIVTLLHRHGFVLQRQMEAPAAFERNRALNILIFRKDSQ